jgi:hypothetical protein
MPGGPKLSREKWSTLFVSGSVGGSFFTGVGCTTRLTVRAALCCAPAPDPCQVMQQLSVRAATGHVYIILLNSFTGADGCAGAFA